MVVVNNMIMMIQRKFDPPKYCIAISNPDCNFQNYKHEFFFINTVNIAECLLILNVLHSLNILNRRYTYIGERVFVSHVFNASTFSINII